MQKNEANLAILTGIFVTALVVSNILASKVVCIGFLEFPAAVIAYPITFLVTDIIGEIWGKKEAQRTVIIGFSCQILSLVLIYIAIALPPASYMVDYSVQYQEVLGSTARTTIASLIAYAVSQSWDVLIFHKFRTGFWAKHKWARNNFSTMTSQVFDTILFIGIAFWGTVSAETLIVMIVSQYFVKWLLALCDTPFFYFFTEGSEEQNPVQQK